MGALVAAVFVRSVLQPPPPRQSLFDQSGSRRGDCSSLITEPESLILVSLIVESRAAIQGFKRSAIQGSAILDQ
jgi:hypothetical protein